MYHLIHLDGINVGIYIYIYKRPKNPRGSFTGNCLDIHLTLYQDDRFESSKTWGNGPI